MTMLVILIIWSDIGAECKSKIVSQHSMYIKTTAFHFKPTERIELKVIILVLYTDFTNIIKCPIYFHIY